MGRFPANPGNVKCRELPVVSGIVQVAPLPYFPKTQTREREDDLRRIKLISLFSIVVFSTLLIGWMLGQRPARSAGSSDADTIPPLYLRSRIALPGVYGRMDHYGLDTKRDTLMVSALGNNTVEVISNWKRVHTITGFEHPQGSLYVPGVDRIVVSSQSNPWCSKPTWHTARTSSSSSTRRIRSCFIAFSCEFVGSA
jgi:hypothetical protein